MKSTFQNSQPACSPAVWTDLAQTRPVDEDPCILLRGVTKQYRAGAIAETALAGIDLSFRRCTVAAVVGKSGCGKTTLLNLIAGIDRPTAGEVIVTGRPIHQLDESTRAVWRGRHVGIVFQFFQLLPTLTVLENVMLPMDFCGLCSRPEMVTRARTLLDRVGIAAHADKLPTALSGGQQQRAAIARALANDPPLLVADEPTGNLDSRTAREVLALLSGLAEQGTTVVIVTHEHDVTRWVDAVVTLEDGRVASVAPGGRNDSANGGRP